MEKFNIKIEHEGQIVPATAVAENGTLTVRSIKYGSKSASASLNNNCLAELLLKELINNSEGKGWGGFKD